MLFSNDYSLDKVYQGCSQGRARARPEDNLVLAVDVPCHVVTGDGCGWDNSILARTWADNYAKVGPLHHSIVGALLLETTCVALPADLRVAPAALLGCFSAGHAAHRRGQVRAAHQHHAGQVLGPLHGDAGLRSQPRRVVRRPPGGEASRMDRAGAGGYPPCYERCSQSNTIDCAIFTNSPSGLLSKSSRPAPHGVAACPQGGSPWDDAGAYVHEVGHTLGLSHAASTSDETYGDSSCPMGWCCGGRK